ncbi:hypothetical protein [Blastococcus mobilis]|uniref:Uncharacterized protein n=1 Tax=Blastococcus mobilis TaxID=1938746 RepID=A0A238VEX1_9ACTN|nr:hypothetical protein [Blastococcus mobilis]SNR32704.1 hypothetical protein SAMN06272737_10343 [Blastococcus mobilis]
MTDDGELVDQLQQLVLRRLAELGEPGRPMSARRAADRSRGLLSFHTLYAIARGEHSGRISDRVAEGLATALDVPVGEVYEAAGAPRPQTRWQLPPTFDRVPPEHRRVFEEAIALYLVAEQRGYERGRRDRS